MKLDRNTTLSSTPTEDPPRRKLLLLVWCAIGILIGLCVFGFVCFLLVR
jgi:LPS O-antigen subunit length determinant protein (WzzB/FepE family)